MTKPRRTVIVSVRMDDRQYQAVYLAARAHGFLNHQGAVNVSAFLRATAYDFCHTNANSDRLPSYTESISCQTSR